jgi:hypothetical protein
VRVPCTRRRQHLRCPPATGHSAGRQGNIGMPACPRVEASMRTRRSSSILRSASQLGQVRGRSKLAWKMGQLVLCPIDRPGAVRPPRTTYDLSHPAGRDRNIGRRSHLGVEIERSVLTASSIAPWASTWITSDRPSPETPSREVVSSDIPPPARHRCLPSCKLARLAIPQPAFPSSACHQQPPISQETRSGTPKLSRQYWKACRGGKGV